MNRIIAYVVMVCVGSCIFQYRVSAQQTTGDNLHLYAYGYVDFFSIYTHMQQVYPDYQYAEKNITFSPYPTQGLINRNSEQPFLYIAAGGMTKSQIGFRTRLSFLHAFSGFNESYGRELSFRNIPSFEMYKYSPHGIFSFTAGDVSEKTFFSPFTLSGQSLVTHPFERLPWDWHKSPFDKYSSLFSSDENPLEVRGLSASQGFVFSADSLLRHFGTKIFYGRTNFSTTPAQVYDRLQAEVTAAKAYYRLRPGFISVNGYFHHQRPFKTGDFEVKNQILSLEYKGRITKNTQVQSELAHSAFHRGQSISKSVALYANGAWEPNNFFTVKTGFYTIPYTFVGKDNAVLNSNPRQTISGIPEDHRYNLLLFTNPLQSPRTMANNRRGLFMAIATKKGKFRFQLEQGISRELEHLHDSLTFFHQTNAFTRSRFSPWEQNSGAYGRIGSRYRFTTETIPVLMGGKLLHFYAADLSINYSTLVASKSLVLLLQPGYRQAGSTYLGAKVFQTWLSDVSAFYALTKNLSLLGFGSLQQNRQSKSTTPVINQKSLAWGLGIDIVVAKNTNFYLRYKNFSHADSNWEADRFRGEEITTELKLFF